MHIISWNKELETGIEIVDNQHRQFLMKANKFVIKFLANKKKEAVTEELEFIKDYLFYHFQTEETFQVDSSYPGYLDHQAEHKHLVFKVKEMEIAFQNMNDDNRDEVFNTFADFVDNWVVHHIMGADLKFAKYYYDLHH